MKYDFEMASRGKIYLPGFMKYGGGVKEILRFCLSNMRNCNIGITGVI
jgi:hypothetical protein